MDSITIVPLRDAESYDPVAESFHRLSSEYAGAFADDVTDSCALGASGRALDLACGTGLVAERILRGGAACVGVDLSDGMLRLANRENPSLPLVRAEAERLPLADGSFDAVVSLFGLLHFDSPGNALREAFRVLRPGGVVVIAIGSPPPWPGPALRRLPGAAFDRLRERQGLLLRAPQSLEDYLGLAGAGDDKPEVGSLEHLVAEAGFEQMSSSWRRRRRRIDSPEEFWELQAVLSTPARKLLAGLPSAEVDRLRTTFVVQCRKILDRGGVLAYDAAAKSIRAVRPPTAKSPPPR